MSNFYVDEAKQLVGKTVTGVLELPSAIRDQFMWDGRAGDSAIMILFDDGTIVIPMQDDEGNGAGVLMYASPAEYTEMTTLRSEMFTQ